MEHDTFHYIAEVLIEGIKVFQFVGRRCFREHKGKPLKRTQRKALQDQGEAHVISGNSMLLDGNMLLDKTTIAERKCILKFYLIAFHSCSGKA
jgi:hypothetical protein